MWYIQAASIGGSDDIQLLDEEGKLREMLQEDGLKVQAVKE